jgi:hypothetical protein
MGWVGALWRGIFKIQDSSKKPPIDLHSQIFFTLPSKPPNLYLEI